MDRKNVLIMVVFILVVGQVAGGGPVSVVGLLLQGEDDVEVGHSGHGRAAGDAAVEIGAVQAARAEGGQDRRLRRRDDGRDARGTRARSPSRAMKPS